MQQPGDIHISKAVIATPLVVTGMQTLSQSGACNKVTVRVEGSITGVKDDGGGVEIKRSEAEEAAPGKSG